MITKEFVAGELESVRRRSLDLLDPLPEPDLLCQHSPLMSPLVWDLAHVGNYEEQWLLGELAAERSAPHLDSVYDAFRHPRKDRPALPMLDPPAARKYLVEVRGRVLDHLDRLTLDDGRPLLDGGFVYGMVVQHEHQHDETMLATLQLRGATAPYPGFVGASGRLTPSSAPKTSEGPPEVLVPGGEFVMGTSTEPWAYDNERPAHTVYVPPVWIDTLPVSNGAYMAFIADQGYARRDLWSANGWRWRDEARLEAPEFWRRDRGSQSGWVRNRFGVEEPVPLDEPVQHVCWYEADAYARWAGRRLPSEAEWEKAAPSISDAGQVWEWTASDFAGYPGFRSYPYREYSEVFFGPDYKVLRGGSWATHPLVKRTTFRNWDFPIRRQIFAGFRTARDARNVTDV